MDDELKQWTEDWQAMEVRPMKALIEAKEKEGYETFWAGWASATAAVAVAVATQSWPTAGSSPQMQGRMLMHLWMFVVCLVLISRWWMARRRARREASRAHSVKELARAMQDSYRRELFWSSPIALAATLFGTTAPIVWIEHHYWPSHGPTMALVLLATGAVTVGILAKRRRQIGTQIASLQALQDES